MILFNIAGVSRSSGQVPTSVPRARIAPLFETAAPCYARLNNVVAIGIGHRRADGATYSIFEVL